MKTGVAKTIAQTIIWSLVLAVIAGIITWTTFVVMNGWDTDLGGGGINWGSFRTGGFFEVAFVAALVGGLVVFPCYFYIRTKISGLVAHMWNSVSWILVLTIWGGIIAGPFGTLFAPVSSIITFALYELYELSKKVRFVRNKQDKGYRLARL